jgi:uncharacterized membrane protein YkvA (DUF1232 family)
MSDYEKVKAEELDAEKLGKINEKIINNEPKKLEFYENLRKKFGDKLPKSKNPNKIQLSDFLFALPDFFILFTRLFMDKRIPKSRKMFISAILGYLVLPIDIIPDFIPILGYVDDLVLVVLALDQILLETDEQIIKDNWSGKSNVIELIRSITKLIQEKLNNPAINAVKQFFFKLSKGK